jgi:DNA-binding GntR family transcriptional regulator
MKSLPDGEVLARHRLQENMKYDEIAQRYGVSRQAVHKAFVKFAKRNDLDWRTRKPVESEAHTAQH